jgi:hypothetical protein
MQEEEEEPEGQTQRRKREVDIQRKLEAVNQTTTNSSFSRRLLQKERANGNQSSAPQMKY